MAYLTYSNVQELATLPSDVTTANITTLITYATAQFNSEVNYKVIREKVEWIDEVRQNDIDGSNKIFYVRNWKEWFLGDLDNDGDVDISDVIVYYVDDSTDPDTEGTMTVSAIDQDDGKITLSTAPASNYELYITYVRAPIDEATPDTLVKTAVAQLTAAYAYLKIDAQKLEKFRVGKVWVQAQSAGSKKNYEAYLKTLNLIRKRPMEAEEGEVLLR